MTEKQDRPQDTPETALTYPFAAPPAPGSVLEVAPGVHWIRMPLPYSLDHINLWSIADGDGCAVVDTGVRTDETVAIWRSLGNSVPGLDKVTRVFVTHMHPDHVGMAGWLTRKFDCRLWMSRLEYLNCRVTTSDTGREAPPDGVAFYRAAGWSETALEAYRARFGRFGQHIHALPDSFRRLQDGDEITIGDHAWRVVIGMGHSPEHACLYSPALKLFISGDQVLPRISSNVSVYPMEPDADPIADWYASLDKIQRQVPDDVLVLPSHNECFRGLHARLDKLRRGQDKSLQRLREVLGEPRRAVDVFGALFSRPIAESDRALLGLATGESIACLNHLVHRGEASRTVRDDGVILYQRT
ncbi:MBL fold metallo-hydrolase [Cupriavidus sp. USMAHM13]|uniref:MBL fold metallo-hydrolase n=1 Tax=Cupriavidus sp. USMAHM13 TaxID=1389192 RepID=UPI0008A7051C|nr:MBL fold metallo-hydrolase [Cupriavidus sp. USMAHM13]AOZ03246.1 MBL fold metallo-hydrolase [Cupriavidus sp. USMAHM13]